MAVHALAPRSDVLTYAVRPSVLLRYLGQLSALLGVLLVPPTAVAAIAGEPGASRLAVVSAAFLALGLAASRAGRGRGMQRNEAIVVAALIYPLAALGLVWPLGAYGLPAMDAWFEAVSGFTTTGLTMLRDVDAAPAGLLFLRAWMQWIGGLGFVVLSLVILRHDSASRRRLGAAEELVVDLALTSVAWLAILLLDGGAGESALYALSAV